MSISVLSSSRSYIPLGVLGVFSECCSTNILKKIIYYKTHFKKNINRLKALLNEFNIVQCYCYGINAT